MIIFLCGPDTYRLREKLNQLKEKFIREVDNSGGNIFVFDEDSADLDKLKSAFFTYSFLVKKKMVILERIAHFKKEILKEISTWLKRLDEDKNLILIAWEGEAAKNRKIKDKNSYLELIDRLRTIKYVFEFPLLSEERLKKWVSDEVKKRSGKIETGAIDLLISCAGDNLWQLNHEINKLIAYKSNEMIKENDVKLLTEAKIDENIFHLVDKAGEKNLGGALKLINQQIEGGINPGYLLIMLVRQFKILLQTKDLLEKKIKFSEIPSQLKLPPFAANKAVRQSQKYTCEELKKIYHQLLEIDLKSKTTQINPIILLNLFVAKLCLA